MPTLSTLVTLLVGLPFVFWAPTAKADCPHNENFSPPHCGWGELPDPAGESPVLVDSDDPPNTVGVVVDIGPVDAQVAFVLDDE